mmetsp:Transcript_21578/g.26436  ORF Transcript_21578/g.26436 Transcript_21578/m.26436 type:complete len:495 (-) Transcript_21578:309-1793(-)
MTKNRRNATVLVYNLILVWAISVSLVGALTHSTNPKLIFASMSESIIANQWSSTNSMAKLQESRSRNCLRRKSTKLLSMSSQTKTHPNNQDFFLSTITKQLLGRTINTAIRKFLPSWIRVYYKRATRARNKSTKPHPERGFSRVGSFRDLAHSRRGIKFVGLYVLGYLTLSVGAFSFLLEPTWTIIDSLYFAVGTFTTVGYGDLSPTTISGKLFTIFFSLYGISILGIALGIIGTNVAEAQEEAMKGVRNRSSRRLMKIFDTIKNDNESDQISDGITANSTSAYSASTSYLESLSKNDDDKLSTMNQDEKSIINQIGSIFVSQLPVLCLILSLAIFFGKKFEGWCTATSIYYCWTTLATVGYGDYSPQSQPMRLFAVFFIPFSVAIAGEMIGRIATIFANREEARAEQRFLARELTMQDLIVMDTDNSGEVSFNEFLTFMLVTMQKVEQDTVDELKVVFTGLNLDGSGTIKKDDLILAVKKRKEQKLGNRTARK